MGYFLLFFFHLYEAKHIPNCFFLQLFSRCQLVGWQGQILIEVLLSFKKDASIGVFTWGGWPFWIEMGVQPIQRKVSKKAGEPKSLDINPETPVSYVKALCLHNQEPSLSIIDLSLYMWLSYEHTILLIELEFCYQPILITYYKKRLREPQIFSAGIPLFVNCPQLFFAPKKSID